MKKEKDIKTILKSLNRKNKTANEIIKAEFEKDVKSGAIYKKGWRYYVHLNKLFSPMEADGLIRQVGTKIGETGRLEKIWSRNNKEELNV